LTFTTWGEWTFYVTNLMGLIAFVGVAVLIARQHALPWRLVAMFGAMALAHPGFRELREGQVTPLIAAAIGGLWLFPKASGWLGVAAGMVKVFPGLGLLWALRQRASLIAPIGLAIAGLLLGGGLWIDWLEVMLNARPGCPDFALPSIGCVTGVPALGWSAAALIAALALKMRSDRVAFFLLAVAMICPVADLYWGHLMVPFMGALPLLAHSIQSARDRQPMNASATDVQPRQRGHLRLEP
jgi:hypothetical protein